MKPLLQRWKPAQLLWLVGAANLASALAVLVVVARSLHLTEGQRLPLQVKVPAFLAIGLSYAASLIAESAAQRGIRYHLWPDSLLAPPRRLPAHPAVAVIMAIMMMGTLLLLIIFLSATRPIGPSC